MAMMFLVMLCLSGGTSRAATTINFDDLSDGETIPLGYDGLSWNNFGAENGADASSDFGYNGYTNGVVSSPNVANNGFGDPAEIYGTAFYLNSADFTAAWRDDLDVSVVGYVGGVATYNTSFDVNTSGPTLETFDWANLSEVEFSTSGGTLDSNVTYTVNPDADGQFAMDNLTIGATPESSTWVPFTTGVLVLAIMTLMGYRRQRQQ